MDILDRPIKSLEDAKAIFLAMGCTHFHMARESPERYEEYKELCPGKELEDQWTRESAIACARALSNPELPEGTLWHIHAHLAELVKYTKASDVLAEFIHATESIIDRLSPRDGIIVAESIIGRVVLSARGGVVCVASDLNDLDSARWLCNTAIVLCERAIESGVEPSRAEAAITKARSIFQIERLMDEAKPL